MAQDGYDDEDALGLEDVESATPSAGPSVSHTPSAAGKRSREDSHGLETGASKKSKAGNAGKDDDEEDLELEDLI